MSLLDRTTLNALEHTPNPSQEGNELHLRYIIETKTTLA
jgi:hypothetical protein